MVASSRSFDRSSGATAIVVGIGGFLYSVSFVIVARSSPDAGRFLSSLFLMLGGVLGIQVMAALYRRLRDVDAGFALAAFMFGFAGALGSSSSTRRARSSWHRRRSRDSLSIRSGTCGSG